MLTALIALALLAPPRFAGGPGWQVGTVPAHACIGVSAARCVEASGWASTVKLRDCATRIPHRTLATLPPSGIVIQLTNVRERPLHGAPQAWPPRIAGADVSAGMEGVPRRYGVVHQFLRDGRHERDLWIWFGRSRPTERQLAAVNAQLRSVR
jgi:hypothetical protein